MPMLLGALLARPVAACPEQPGAPEGVRLAVASVDVQQRFDAWRVARGESPTPLACRDAWKGQVHLCLRVWEEGRRRWVTEADLAAWHTDLAAVEARLAAAAPAFLGSELRRVEIAGMKAVYWVASDGDGAVAAALVAPAALAAKIGGPPLRAAFPSEGVLVAWQVPADADVDRAMLVGVREMYATQAGPVSPTAHTWDGEHWTPFARAEPTPPSALDAP